MLPAEINLIINCCDYCNFFDYFYYLLVSNFCCFCVESKSGNNF